MSIVVDGVWFVLKMAYFISYTYALVCYVVTYTRVYYSVYGSDFWKANICSLLLQVSILPTEDAVLLRRVSLRR